MTALHELIASYDCGARLGKITDAMFYEPFFGLTRDEQKAFLAHVLRKQDIEILPLKG